LAYVSYFWLICLFLATFSSTAIDEKNVIIFLKISKNLVIFLDLDFH